MKQNESLYLFRKSAPHKTIQSLLKVGNVRQKITKKNWFFLIFTSFL